MTGTMKQPAVYILASDRNGTLYTGVTSDLIGRVWQHREHLVDGFSKRYCVTRLVWYELHSTMDSAITREKRIKKWNRTWKLELIQKSNPKWLDLWPQITGEDTGMDYSLCSPLRGRPSGVLRASRLSRIRGNDEGSHGFSTG